MTPLSPPGVLRLPDGCVIRGRGLGQPAPTGAAPGFGLYLGSPKLRRRYDADLTWPHEWIRWPDFLLPWSWPAAARRITALHERARRGESVEVACFGGTGRTGTVLACMATSTGLPAKEAVAWVRQNYRPRAVEMRWQAAWVGWFAWFTKRC